MHIKGHHYLSSDGEWSIFGSDSEESQSEKKTSLNVCPVPAVESLAPRASIQICDTPQVVQPISARNSKIKVPAVESLAPRASKQKCGIPQVVQPISARNSKIKVPAVESLAPRASKQICDTPQVNISHSFNIISLSRPAFNKRPGLRHRSPTPNTDLASV
ncbi:uncharacterized protein LOC132927357 [Rhopalosiphum padi]|uniref:uncharacterized protein LOC132927357 n=1 Tax=Rhopalosiphum padi TaxID=40932 RepID=UPI00298E2F29|nr:uncharacterized protein LOC132927357 [Rhopalosiphum padi]